MTKDIQRAILRACARFIGKKVELVERRIVAVEERAAAALTEKDLTVCRDGIDCRLRELQLTPGPQGEPGRDAEPVDVDAVVDAVIAKLLSSDRLVVLSDVGVGAAVARYLEENPVRDGIDGANATDAQVIQAVRDYMADHPPSPGADGTGLADALIDRDGALVVTMTDGRAKSLGVVVGRDGTPGENGRDGLSMMDVSRTYDAEAHEIVERWTVAGEAKELRYPAGGIRPGGFWREGMKSHALQAVTHDGALWIAKRDTAAKPCIENADDWQLAARKGRDGRDGKDGKPPPGPVKLGGGDGA